jgi:hypothetical protein
MERAAVLLCGYIWLADWHNTHEMCPLKVKKWLAIWVCVW